MYLLAVVCHVHVVVRGGITCNSLVHVVVGAHIASVGYTHVSLDCSIDVVAGAWHGVVGSGISCSHRLRHNMYFIGTC